MTADPDQGYRIVASVFDAEEMSELLRALDSSPLTRSRAGARHLMHQPTVCSIAMDPRLLTIAREFVGPTASPYRATFFDKSSSRNWLVPWHQDTALPLEARSTVRGWGPWSVKAGITYAHAPASALERVIALRLHLDDSRPDNGPLRVMPGTHKLGVLSDTEIDRVASHTLYVECLAPLGGVIAMRPLIVHASSKATSDRPRRVLHLEYVDSLDVGSGLRIAKA